MVVLIQITGEFESTPSLKYTFSYTNVNYYHTSLFLAALWAIPAMVMMDQVSYIWPD